jgi:hypothetical protein
MQLGILVRLLSSIILVCFYFPVHFVPVEWLSIVDCGMTHMPDVNVRNVLKARVPEAGDEIDEMSFGEIIE